MEKITLNELSYVNLPEKGKKLYFHFEENSDSSNLIIQSLYDSNEALLFSFDPPEENDVKIIQVLVLLPYDSLVFTIYHGNNLAPIQEYLIVKEIFSTYNQVSLNAFIDSMETLSLENCSAAKQSNELNSNKIKVYVEKVFNTVKAAL